MSITIGQQLRQTREGRALTIEQAAAATRIRAHYLQAIESGDFGALPSFVQGRGFLRAYAGFLGLDPDQLIQELEQGSSPEAQTTAADPSPVELLPPVPMQDEPGVSIFAEVGERLRRQREVLGLSLEDVERHTHLRQHYLIALEAGDLEGLPSPVQGRGMLNNYASFLGLNPEQLLLRFADGLQAQLHARRAVQAPPASSVAIREAPARPSLLRRFLSPDVLIGGSVVALIIIFITWGAIRIFGILSIETLPTATAPSIAEILLATATPTLTATPEPATPTNPPQAALLPTFLATAGTPIAGEPPADTGAAVQVYLTIQQRAWMRILVDGQVQFDGRVLPGSAYPFIGNIQVEVLTGNGAAIRVFFNGVDLGVMGDTGQIVNRIFSTQGVLTPTPTITPASTIAPPVAPTDAGGEATPEANSVPPAAP